MSTITGISLGALLGVLGTKIWELAIFKLGHRQEIEKKAMDIYFTFAKDYYLRICHILECLKSSLEEIYKNQEVDDLIYKHFFFYFILYLTVMRKFNDKCGTWFLSSKKNEKLIREAAQKIGDILPFNSYNRCSLMDCCCLQDTLHLPDQTFLTFAEFCSALNNDDKLKDQFSIFKEWAKSDHDKEQSKMEELLNNLKVFSDTLINDLDHVFKQWYEAKKAFF